MQWLQTVELLTNGEIEGCTQVENLRPEDVGSDFVALFSGLIKVAASWALEQISPTRVFLEAERVRSKATRNDVSGRIG